MKFITRSDVDNESGLTNYGDDVHDVLNSSPHWIIRNGIVILFIVFLMLLLISFVIKFPDVVKSEISITSYDTPAEIKARASGRLSLFIEDNTLVRKGLKLGFISNASDFDHVQMLHSYLNEVKPLIDQKKIEDIRIPQSLSLGELERPFLNYNAAWQDFLSFRNIDGYTKNIADLKNQVDLYARLEKELEDHREIIKEELQVASKTFRRDSLLFKENVISPLDFERSRGSYLPFKKQLGQVEQSIISNKLRKTELTSRLNDLTISYQESVDKLRNAVVTQYNALVSEMKIWEEKYLLVSPMDGKISFFEFWNNNQNAEAGSTILTVIPETNNIFGYLLMPMQGSGKVKTGQEVNIRLYNYPYNEFGMLKGVVYKISDVPQNNFYAVTVRLSNGLTTTHKVTLEFKEQMKGSADIITEDYRLIERFFHQLNRVFSEAEGL